MYLYQILEKVVPPIACVAVLGVFVGVPALAMGNEMRHRRARKARLVGRETMRPDEWFARYVPDIASDRDMLIELLCELSKELDVEWTQLRPEDTFSSTFALHNEYDDLIGFWCAEEDWVKKHGIDVDALPGLPADTLAEYLARADALLQLRRADRSKSNVSIS